MRWATFWAIFSSTHLVTLPLLHKTDECQKVFYRVVHSKESRQRHNFFKLQVCYIIISNSNNFYKLQVCHIIIINNKNNNITNYKFATSSSTITTFSNYKFATSSSTTTTLQITSLPNHHHHQQQPNSNSND
jgi:hypothetical protein